MNNTMQQILEMRLSEDSESALNNCLGKSFLDIWAPSLDISPEVEGVAFSPSFSIPFTSLKPLSGWNGFLTLQIGQWGDTKEFCIDCFEIVIEKRDSPLGLEDKYNGISISGQSSVHFWGDASSIKKIEIREIEQTHTVGKVSETVKYDHSLYFERESGRKLIISAGDAFHHLSIAWSDYAISKLIKETRLRKTLE
jgi:hypothetical protein